MPAKKQGLRWDEESWEQVQKVAESVGLKRSEFIRRATLAAMALPHALCGVRSTPHNAAPGSVVPNPKHFRKEVVWVKGGEAETEKKADGDSRPAF